MCVRLFRRSWIGALRVCMTFPRLKGEGGGEVGRGEVMEGEEAGGEDGGGGREGGRGRRRHHIPGGENCWEKEGEGQEEDGG